MYRHSERRFECGPVWWRDTPSSLLFDLLVNKVAIIGGTGLTQLDGLEVLRREVVSTPYGEPSAPIIHGALSGREVAFIARHGYSHTIPPHRVNYRANIWALKQIGIDHVIAVAAVGGIDPAFSPGRIAFPDQLVDYTWSRAHTFFEEDLSKVVHVDFTEPYCESLRQTLIKAARAARLDAIEHGTYAATQGPRLETAAEVDRLERDGCHMVGMTGMPEVVLARELELRYATCAVVVNPAAGRGDGPITEEVIAGHLGAGISKVRALLARVMESA
jgi:5'-methylthioinosine phosphorylase